MYAEHLIVYKSTDLLYTVGVGPSHNEHFNVHVFSWLFKETECEYVDWIHVVCDTVRLQSLLNKAMSNQIP
jgi:hypothetical protein